MPAGVIIDNNFPITDDNNHFLDLQNDSNFGKARRNHVVYSLETQMPVYTELAIGMDSVDLPADCMNLF